MQHEYVHTFERSLCQWIFQMFIVFVRCILHLCEEKAKLVIAEKKSANEYVSVRISMVRK